MAAPSNGYPPSLAETVTVKANTSYVFSFYAKLGTVTEATYGIYNNNSSTNIVGPTSYYSQLNSSSLTRISVSFTTPTGCTSITVNPLYTNSSLGTITISSLQLELGTTATGYQNTYDTSSAALGIIPAPAISYSFINKINSDAILRSVPLSAVPNKSSTLQKQVEVIRSDRTTIRTDRVKSGIVLRSIPLSATSSTLATLQKQLEVIRADRTTIRLATLQKQLEVIRADRTVIRTDRVKSGIVLRSSSELNKPLPSILRSKLFVSGALTAFYAPNSSNLNQYTDFRNTGDFKFAVTGQSSDYTTVTRTFYFASQQYTPFTVGSTVKISNIYELTAYYSTVLASNYSSVTITMPSWNVPGNGTFVESGATVYSQYQGTNRASRTGSPIDNFYLFNTAPSIRADHWQRVDVRTTPTAALYAPLSGNMQKAIETVRAAQSILNTDKIKSASVLRSDRAVLSYSQLQKQLEVIRSDKTVNASGSINRVKLPANSSSLFYTPSSSQLQKQLEVIRATISLVRTDKVSSIQILRPDRTILKTDQVKSGIVVRSSSELNKTPAKIEQVKIPKNATYVFYTPSSSQLQKQLEVIRATISLVRTDKINSTQVLRSDRIVLKTDRVKSGIVVRSGSELNRPIPRIEKNRVPAIWTSVYFAPSSSNLTPYTDFRNPGDFKFAVTGQSSDRTFYFATQTTVPFTVGSTVKISNIYELTTYYSNIIAADYSSVTIATPSWNIPGDGTFVETGATVYSQYLGSNRASRTGSPIDNFYSFNTAPSIRADHWQRVDVRTTPTIGLYTPSSGNMQKAFETVRAETATLQYSQLQKQLEVIRADRITIRSGKVNSAAALRGIPNEAIVFDPNNLQKQLEIVRADKTGNASGLVNKVKVPSNSSSLFYTPLIGKTNSTAALRGIPKEDILFDPNNLQKQLEVIRADRTTLRTDKVGANAVLRDIRIKITANNVSQVKTPSVSLFYAPTSSNLQLQLFKLRADTSVIKTDKISANAVLRSERNRFTTNIVNTFKVPVRNTAVFYAPRTDKVNSMSVLRADRTTIRTDKVNSVAALRADQAVLRVSEVISGLKYPSLKTQVFFTPRSTNVAPKIVVKSSPNNIFTSKLAQFAPDLLPGPGDFKLSIIRQSTDLIASSNILSYYLNDNDILSPVASVPELTKTFYFTPTTSILFDIGSTIKITDPDNQVIYYATVTDATFNSVSFAQPTWTLSTTNAFIETGSTLFLQSYVKSPSNPTNARENLYYFNVAPGARADKAQHSTPLAYPIQTLNVVNPGTLQKQLEVVRADRTTVLSVNKLSSSIVVRADRNILRVNKLAASIIVRENLVSITGLATIKTGNLQLQLFKLRDIPDTRAIGQLQKQLEVIKGLAANQTVNLLAQLKVNKTRTQVFFGPEQGQVIRLKTGDSKLGQSGIQDPSVQRKEPVQFWN